MSKCYIKGKKTRKKWVTKFPGIPFHLICWPDALFSPLMSLPHHLRPPEFAIPQSFWPKTMILGFQPHILVLEPNKIDRYLPQFRADIDRNEACWVANIRGATCGLWNLLYRVLFHRQLAMPVIYASKEESNTDGNLCLSLMAYLLEWMQDRLTLPNGLPCILIHPDSAPIRSGKQNIV